MTWQVNLIHGAIITIIGFAMILSANAIEIPAPYKTFLGIPYATNPDYQVTLLLKLGLGALGIVAICGGIGIVLISYLKQASVESK
jgi:hypothetical protein